MNDVIKMVRFWRYNKRKKNWRSLNHYYVSKKRWNVRAILLLCAVFEVLYVFPNQRERFVDKFKNLVIVSQKLSVENEEGYSFGEEDGEVKERGVVLDLKEGELKFWQKVERKIFYSPD